MLHVWLIPAAVVFAVVVAVLYFVLKVWGGDGVRTDGRTLLDNPEEDNAVDTDQ